QRRVMLEQRLEGVGQHLIRAVADEHLAGRDAVVGRDRLAQRGSARIGVKAQTIGCRGDSSERARRRSVRILVGIELDEAIKLRLLAGHVWREAADDRTPETAHDLRPKVELITLGNANRWRKSARRTCPARPAGRARAKPEVRERWRG